MKISAETENSGKLGTLMVHLLGRCNLQCLHCYMEGSPSRKEYLPLDHVIAAISECEQLGIGALYLTGGEPLLYKEIFNVLQATVQIPGFQTTLCTNATSMTQRHIDKLRETNTRVNVSIDGERDFHNHFRNSPGAFDASERSIRAMSEAGIPVTIITTISKGNIHSLPKLVEWAAELGVEQFRVQPLLKLGRRIQISDQRLTAAQMNFLLLQLSDLANTYRSKGLTCSLIGASRKFLMEHPCGAYVCNGTGCHRRVAKEIKKLVVREDGTVLPEVTNLSYQFALGKINNNSLSHLVNSYLDNGGYDQFDQLCRATYSEVLPTWESEAIPWDQIVAERSYEWNPLHMSDVLSHGCGACN